MNARFQTAIILMVLVFALGEGMIMAQQTEVPILKPRAKPVTAATLLVMCDLACNWKLDGETKGHIDAGGSAKAKIELGQHALVAATDDGLDKVEKDIEIKTAGQTIFRVVLQPVRNDRIQYSRMQIRFTFANTLPNEPKLARTFTISTTMKKRNRCWKRPCGGGALTACITLGAEYENDNSLFADRERKTRGQRMLLSESVSKRSDVGMHPARHDL